jgi:Glycosyl hydrolase family 115/Gylcosyl hydrolase family 115 C-terminal domain
MRERPRASLFTVALLFIFVAPTAAHAALGDPSSVRFAPTPGAFPLAGRDSAAALVVGRQDWPGVLRAARDLQADVARVAGHSPTLVEAPPAATNAVVLVGTLGRNEYIDRLVSQGSLDVSAIRGAWEAHLMQVVSKPFPGVDQALVIVGSDKRGTIYGIYDLSQQIGVSPWYWWADVPIASHHTIQVMPAAHIVGSPAIKYRGIFLNDEAPELTGWANEKFGGLNSRFYARVFELLLRLRANYLWPAMWANAFNEDDPDNARLADEYGIVMGTSHHEPMLRSRQEWKRHGQGPWNYQTNADTLSHFWADGIRRNRSFESIVTLGMRGDGDTPMSEMANVELLQRIVADQRSILAREMNPDTRVPQLWALYKEVQQYYEKGMRVPEDVTLLWCDDNWGNIRRLPTPEERTRPGGAGVYYHFDYVGGPRSYKWLNTIPISKVWEQMQLAWRYGADRIWIVNVGDLKPLEFPIEFFLTYAWAPDQWPYERLSEFGKLWATREFGAAHSDEIGELVAAYTKFNGRRKPESLAADTFSLVNYDEARRVIADWNTLVARAERVGASLPPASHDAYFQLVLWPIRASATVNEIYVTAGLNRMYAMQGRASTNTTAERVRKLFRADEALSYHFNEELGGGRWRHFADQTHLGYTIWKDPSRNAMPPVSEIQVTERGELGVALEGSTSGWPPDVAGTKAPSLPQLNQSARKPRWLEVFDRGRTPVGFSVATSAPWLRVSPSKGEVASAADLRLEVSVDWAAAPEGSTDASIQIQGTDGGRVVIAAPVVKQPSSLAIAAGTYIESDGYIAIEAMHFANAIAGEDVSWQTLPGFGRTDGAVMPIPVTAASQKLSKTSPRLEYHLYTTSTGEAKVELTLAPTLAFVPGRGLRAAVSFDDEPPQIIDLTLAGEGAESEWARSVLDGARKVVTTHKLAGSGAHVLKFWMIDPAVVLERIVVDFGGVRPSYLGPPESVRQDSQSPKSAGAARFR